MLISIDGMRADRAHFDGNPHLTTPNLDALAAQGIRFPDSYSQSNESLLSHAPMLTGRFSSEIAYPDYLRYYLPEDAVLVSEMLDAAGYDTGAFLAGGHIKGVFGFDQGFDAFFESEDFGSFHETVPAAIRWLAGRPEDAPFFIFLHGYDCHRPYLHDSVFFHPFTPGEKNRIDKLLKHRNFTEHVYDKVAYADFSAGRVWHSSGERMLNPDAYLDLPAHAALDHDPEDVIPIDDKQIDHIFAHYDGAVLAADTYVGLFLEALQLAGRWDDTLVIVTADHGEDLQDHGYFNHRAVIFDSTTRVPFILGGGLVPEATRGTVRPELVQAVDVVATIAQAAGTVPPGTSRGRGVWGAATGGGIEARDIVFQEGVLGQLSARTARFRLVFTGFRLTDPELHVHLAEEPLGGGHFALYESLEDPKEQVDVLSAFPQEAQRMREALVAWHASLDHGTGTRQLTPSEQKMLQDHGYW
ncbi:MAG: sulfatase [Pseudomonadota bacterium]